MSSDRRKVRKLEETDLGDLKRIFATTHDVQREKSPDEHSKTKGG